MRLFGSLAATWLCTLVMAGAAHASDVEGMRAMFREMDTNGDRALQYSEIRAARARLFDRIDGDGDGVLDRDEIDMVREVAESRAAGRHDLAGDADIAGRARLIDANGDGRIARDEFAAYIPPRLQAADKNGDRTLSLRELRSLKRDR